MKKYKKIAYIILFLLICVFGVFIYLDASNKNKEEDIHKKTYTEVIYLESKLVDLFNTMNNIEIRNYNISVGKISKKSEESQSQINSSNPSSKSGGDSNESTSNVKEGQGLNEQDTNQYEMNFKGILTNQDDINWNYIKTEIENLYISIPTITMDLYKIEVNNNDILNFNKELDNLTKSVEEENKINTLKELSVLYDYIPIFAEKTENESLKIKVLKVKSYLFKAYSKLDENKWEEIVNDLNVGIEEYSKLLTDTNIESEKQSCISKIYIMINELKNAANMKDISIFLIKYKNLIEEIDNL